MCKAIWVLTSHYLPLPGFLLCLGRELPFRDGCGCPKAFWENNNVLLSGGEQHCLVPPSKQVLTGGQGGGHKVYVCVIPTHPSTWLRALIKQLLSCVNDDICLTYYLLLCNSLPKFKWLQICTVLSSPGLDCWGLWTLNLSVGWSHLKAGQEGSTF